MILQSIETGKGSNTCFIVDITQLMVDMFVATWRRNIATQMDFVALSDAQIERNRKS